MSNFTTQNKCFNLPNSPSESTTNQSQRCPLNSLMLRSSVFVEVPRVALISRILIPQHDSLLGCCGPSQSLQVHNTIFQITKPHLNSDRATPGTLARFCGLLARELLEDRLVSCSSSLCWVDLNSPWHWLQLSSLHTRLPGPAPRALPASPVTWYTLYSRAS